MNFGGVAVRALQAYANIRPAASRLYRSTCHTPKLTLVFPAFQPRRFIAESLYVHRPGVCCVLLMDIIFTYCDLIVNHEM